MSKFAAESRAMTSVDFRGRRMRPTQHYCSCWVITASVLVPSQNGLQISAKLFVFWVRRKDLSFLTKACQKHLPIKHLIFTMRTNIAKLSETPETAKISPGEMQLFYFSLCIVLFTQSNKCMGTPAFFLRFCLPLPTNTKAAPKK